MSELRVVLIPGTLALVPEYAGSVDPVPQLRAAVGEALTWLGQEATQAIHVVCVDASEANVARGASIPPAARIVKALGALHLPTELPEPTPDSVTSVIVVGNGSAMRDEKAPGHFDPRAQPFDAEIERALRTFDPAPLVGLDVDLAEQLWMYDSQPLGHLGEVFASHHVTGRLLYSEAPFGVQYWVGCWRAVAG